MSFCGLSTFSRVRSQSASFFLQVYPCINKNIVAIFIWYVRTAIYRVNFQRQIQFPCVVLIKRLPRFYHSFSLCWFFLKPGLFVQEKTQSPSPRQEKFSKPVRFFPDPVIPINNEPSLNGSLISLLIGPSVHIEQSRWWLQQQQQQSGVIGSTSLVLSHV